MIPWRPPQRDEEGLALLLVIGECIVQHLAPPPGLEMWLMLVSDEEFATWGRCAAATHLCRHRLHYIEVALHWIERYTGASRDLKKFLAPAP